MVLRWGFSEIGEMIVVAAKLIVFMSIGDIIVYVLPSALLSSFFAFIIAIVVLIVFCSRGRLD